MIYNNLDYARSRLSSSVIMVKNRPSYVTSINIRDSMSALDLIGQEAARFHLKGGEYDITPVKLGFINTPAGCVYASRTAKRQWKQGLSIHSLVVKGYSPADTDYLLRSRNLGECIGNIYPTLEEAFNQSTHEKGVAFSRNFFIKAGSVWNRNRMRVGDLKHDKIVLHRDYSYLKEQLEEYSK